MPCKQRLSGIHRYQSVFAPPARCSARECFLDLLHAYKPLPTQEYEIDYISLSYCSSVEDLTECRAFLDALGMFQTKIIAKVGIKGEQGSGVNASGCGFTGSTSMPTWTDSTLVGRMPCGEAFRMTSN